MASNEIRNPFITETPDDRYWYENLHAIVAVEGARLEKKAYEYVTKTGAFTVGNATRKGQLFRTPLSQMSCSDIKARVDIMEGLQEYIEKRFNCIDEACCQELTMPCCPSFQFPKTSLFFYKPTLSASYDDMRSALRGKDCKEKFCEQLSDQLVFCDKCHQRPILYNIIRDEDFMKYHLSEHRRESKIHVEEIERIKKMLLSKLEAGVFQSRAEGYGTKNA